MTKAAVVEPEMPGPSVRLVAEMPLSVLPLINEQGVRGGAD